MSDENDTFNPSLASYTPSEVASYGVQGIERVRDSKDRSIYIGIEGLNDYFAPLRPGQVAGIVGQTSHYKSGLLHHIEHKVALQLAGEKREGEAIIHVSLEESVEEQAFLEFARVSGEDAGKLANGEVKDWDRLISLAYRVSDIPIYRIGDSLARSDYIPRLYLSNVIKAIRYVVGEFKVKPAMIAVDYLQALPVDPEIRKYDYDTQRRLQVRMDAYRLREIASMFGCPVLCCCQAKQTLGALQVGKAPSVLIPGIYDINESADVAQRFDRLIGVWLPARSYPVGTELKIGQHRIEITDDLFFVKVNKQRGGYPAGRTFLCSIDFMSNTIKVRSFDE